MKKEKIKVGIMLYVSSGEEGIRFLSVDTLCSKIEGGIEVDSYVTFKGIGGYYLLSFILENQEDWRKKFPPKEKEVAQHNWTVGGHGQRIW